MKQNRDLVRDWLRKAESDLKTLEAAIGVEAFDTACFHAQQASEKALKAFLISADVEFPFTHNLTKLVGLCATVNPVFLPLADVAESLTPFAVELRYDAEFWPDEEKAKDAQQRAREIVETVNRVLGGR